MGGGQKEEGKKTKTKTKASITKLEANTT